MKLSVIIPVYNGADTIAFALESILYQNVNFEFEVIVFDDCSTDDTRKIIQIYAAKFPCVKYHANPVNVGNAETFFNATRVARGEYFHVLDADDFFTCWNKLQKQVDFLDHHQDYCAVGHESIRLCGDSINFDELKKCDEDIHPYEYNVEKLFGFYYHTSTFMYKNVFRNESYEILKQDFCRGDEIRTQLVRAICNEKIKRIPLIGSVYNFHGQGIWSGMPRQDQVNYSVHCLTQRCEQVFSGVEKRAILDKLATLEINRFRTTSGDYMRLGESLNEIHRLLTEAGDVEPETREELFQNCNYFPQADQLLEAIGRICLFNKRRLLLDRQFDEDTYLFTVCGFKTAQGSGIIREILELVETFLSAGKRVVICSTELVATDQGVIDAYFSGDRVKFIRAEGASRLEKLEFLIDEIHAIRPGRMYPFVSHYDVVGAALLQKHLAGEIVMSWVYDHGTSLGVSSSSISSYIAKTSSYYYTLKSIGRHNRINIIPVSFEQKRAMSYVPFKNHSKLITATASARSYKVETKYKYGYINVVAEMLRRTGGTHYHYGPLPDSFKQQLLDTLANLKVDTGKFIHIEWVADLSLSLIENEVDLFLASFPVGSARIAVEVNSIGIPIMAHRGINRIFSLRGFISPDNFWWAGTDELFSRIGNLDAESLSECAAKVRKFYEANNDPLLTRPLLLNNGSVPYEPELVTPKSFVDIPIMNIQACKKRVATVASGGSARGGWKKKKRVKGFKKLRYQFSLGLFRIPFLGRALISEKKIERIRRKLSF